MKMILNEPQPQDEEITVEGQLDSEQEGAPQNKYPIFCGKYRHHHHVFINFKEAFDRVRHEAL